MGERKKKEQAQPEGAPGWMVTYGDMMGLLLTFFILLLSFSSINEKEFQEALSSLRGALGVLPGGLGLLTSPPSAKQSRITKEDMQRMARDLQKMLDVKALAGEIKVGMDNEQGGVLISLPSNVLFDTSSAVLLPEASSILNQVASVLSPAPGAFIEVRGHTDNRPLRNAPQFNDNLDLSYNRAKAVMSFLASSEKLKQDAFETIACGDSQPIATNETEEGRQKNRRVDLFIRGEFPGEMKKQIEDSVNQLGGGEAPKGPPPIDIDIGTNANEIR